MLWKIKWRWLRVIVLAFVLLLFSPLFLIGVLVDGFIGFYEGILNHFESDEFRKTLKSISDLTKKDSKDE